ncbi:MAG: glucosamine-6-phosphate deaminase [Acidobacteria bacterium]|nr:glucosamine-6-phosphate deaminase [Acidobacteriota bacterium]
MEIRVFDSADEAARAVADRVARALAERPSVVLGLPTGRTPVAAYAELRRRHAAGDVDFSRATTFNLDEFAGVHPSHAGSFRTYMERHLFGGVNIRRDRIHVLDGAAPDLDAECERYEDAIAAAGGIDLLLLGIGANGHLGFNEPAAELAARTHRVRLAESTRRDNAALFGGDPACVPREALSMGMGTILKASTLVLLATGERKARCIERAVRGPLTTHLPASFLQVHRSVELYLDRAAAVLL